MQLSNRLFLVFSTYFDWTPRISPVVACANIVRRWFKPAFFFRTRCSSAKRLDPLNKFFFLTTFLVHPRLVFWPRTRWIWPTGVRARKNHNRSAFNWDQPRNRCKEIGFLERRKKLSFQALKVSPMVQCEETKKMKLKPPRTKGGGRGRGQGLHSKREHVDERRSEGEKTPRKVEKSDF